MKERTDSCGVDRAETPSFDGFVCEYDAGHYPATPHGAFVAERDSQSDLPPTYWNDDAVRTDAAGNVLAPFRPPLQRAAVEAKIANVQRRIVALAQRGVGIDGGQLIMDRLTRLTEIVIGDMDDQRRLAFENALFDHYASKLDATEPAVNQALLARGVSPGGIILPGTNGGKP